jgi:hypothetical protein
MFPALRKTSARTLLASGGSKMSGGHASKEGPTPDRRILELCLPYPEETSANLPLNLFPVVECPQYFYCAEARLRTESEVKAAAAGPGPVPFLLRNNRLYTFEPVHPHSALAPAVKMDVAASQESFTNLLAKPDCAPVAIELLDRMLRYHAWKRGLRYDETHQLFYFTRSKPKTVVWEINGQIIRQEVTAPRLTSIAAEHGVMAEAQFGWKHRAIRAGFVQIRGALLLRLEPAWFMTELDGKTPATEAPSVPTVPDFANRDEDPEMFRLLQFWSVVLTKAHRELRIPAGRNPIRVRLTRTAAPIRGGTKQYQTDPLVRADTGDEKRIPELVPV